jgi:hypothetical protein
LEKARTERAEKGEDVDTLVNERAVITARMLLECYTIVYNAIINVFIDQAAGPLR